MKEEERLKPWMKPLAEEDYPEACKPCKYRHLLRWFKEGIPLCEHSFFTCVNRTRPCSDFERDNGKQLTLFDHET